MDEDNARFGQSMISSLFVTAVSEVGDKTFFIAAILAMHHSRLSVFLGSFCGEGIMSILSGFLGYVAVLIPIWVIHYASSALFVFYGLQMFKEAYKMDKDEEEEEYELAYAEVKKRSEVEKKDAVETSQHENPLRSLVCSLLTSAFLEAFAMTFFAEFGDRSQIATVFLAARDKVSGVIIGGLIGHALCTGLAVIGGRFVVRWISLRNVHVVGGFTFLICAVSTYVF